MPSFTFFPVNIVFPWLNVPANLTGVGKSARAAINFKNVTDRTFYAQGNWYDYVSSWQIPTYVVTQDPSIANDYDTHFDRAQQALAANNQYSNVVENADTLVDNAALNVTANSATTTASNYSVTMTAAAQATYNNNICRVDNSATIDSSNASITAQEQQAAIAAASGVASAAVGAIGSLATGNVGGAIGSIAGGVIGGAATMASSAVGVQLTASSAGFQTANNSFHAVYANDLSNNKSTYTQNAQNDITAAQNALTTGSAANSSAMQLANGHRDLATANSAITN